MLLTIADLILRLAKEEREELTPMKLMKLTYIANGWSLASRDEALFNETIEAWKYGPVMPELYYVTKQFGGNPIPLNKIDDNVPDTLKDKLGEEVISFVEKIYNAYKDNTAVELSNLTHRPGTPWDEIHQYGKIKVIPPSLIKKYYKNKLNDR